jgi:hypothetical protein
LYRAKSGGRDQVQMISTTRGLSAISGTDDRADGGGKGSRPEAPSVFRRAQISLSGGPRLARLGCWLRPLLSFR